MFSEYIKGNFESFCLRNGLDYDSLKEIVDAMPNVEGAWLAGGVVRRTLIKQPLDSDFDYFFKSKSVMDDWEGRLPKTLKLVNETKHHKHWRGPVGESGIDRDIQAIHFKYYKDANEVIDSFDYTITQMILCGEDLIISPLALWDLGRKRLAIHKVTYPVATMRRMLKYCNQDFTACGGTMSTLFRETANSAAAMSQLDIEYVD